MPFNGVGVFNQNPADYPAVLATVISETKRNNIDADVANGLTNCVTRDGQSPATANIPMGGFKVTGAAAGVASTDLVNVSQLNIATSRGTFKNRIHNGNFSINQRSVSGAVVLAAGAYGHDRWKAGAAGCSYTFATSANVTTITISAGSLKQVIEGNSLLSDTYVLSWAGTSTGKIDGGAYSATGATGTATGGTNLTVEFSTGTLSKVQFEQGSVATTFDLLPYSIDLDQCKRYLPSQNAGTGGNAAYYPGQCFTGTTGFIPMPFDIQARVPPTGILTIGAGSYTVNQPAGAGVVVSVAFNTGSVAGGGLTFSGASGLAAGGATCLGITSGGTLLWTGCEL